MMLSVIGAPITRESTVTRLGRKWKVSGSILTHVVLFFNVFYQFHIRVSSSWSASAPSYF